MVLNKFNDIYRNNLWESTRITNRARKYLNNRNIDNYQIKHFRLGFCRGNDYLKMLKNGHSEKEILESNLVKESKKGMFYDYFFKRITIPLFLFKEIKTFTSRAIDDNPIPHLHKMGRFSIAFNHNILFEEHHVIITESPIDTMTLHSYGYPSIALLGANKITRRVISDLQGLTIYICFDYDPISQIGKKKAQRLAQKLLNHNISSYICDFSSIYDSQPKHKIDANSFFKNHKHKDFNKIISKSREFFGKKITYKKQYDFSGENIVDIISQYAEVIETGDNYKCLCPLHKDSKPSMVIYKDSNSFYCFGCNVGGGVSRFKKLIGHYERV